MHYGKRFKVIQVVHHPVGARAFIEPIVDHLNQNGISCGLWLESVEGAERFVKLLKVQHELVPCDIGPNPFVLLDTLRQLRRKIRVLQPEILHCHQTRGSLLPLIVARWERISVRVYHNHGLSYVAHGGLRRVLMKQVDRLNIRLATHVLFVSKSTLEKARQDGLLQGKRAAVLGSGTISGIDLSRFPLERTQLPARMNARQELNLPANAFIAGYVGRPVVHKGFPQMLAGWQKSGLAAKGAVLLLAGCRPKDVTNVVGTGNGGMRALGYQEDMLPFYAACDIVALPSRTEGFAYSLLEAAAMGRSLIGSDVLGNKDAVRHEYNGLLVPPDDPEALAGALLRLESDPEFRRRLGGNGRKLVESLYIRETVLGALVEYYRQFLLPAVNSEALDELTR